MIKNRIYFDRQTDRQVDNKGLFFSDAVIILALSAPFTGTLSW